MKINLIRGFCLTILFLSTTLWSAFEDVESGTRPQGMGNAFTAVADEPSAIHFNPAGLTQVENLQINLLYKRLFSTVNNTTVDVAIPSKFGIIGISVQEVSVKGDVVEGSKVIKKATVLEADRVFTLSHAIPLTEELSFGYNFLTYQLHQERFGDDATLGVDFGFHSRVYRKFRLGLFAHNVNIPKIRGYELPRGINTGIAFEPMRGVLSSFDLSKEIGYPTRIQFGQEFNIAEYLTFRGGLQSEPVRMSVGLGIKIKGLRFDYACVNHELLPLTHLFGVKYGN